MQAKPRLFSRFFHDIRHRPKHYPSLPLQTGFPTSLIHILLKNQHRLNKSPSKCKKTNKPSTPSNANPHVPSSPLSSQFRVPDVLDSSPQTPLPPCISPEFPSPASEIRFPGTAASEIATPAFKTRVPASEIAAPASETRVPVCRNSTRRLLEMAISLSIVAILALTTKRIAIGIAITAFIFSFLRSLQWRASRSRLLTPAISNLTGEEEEEEEEEIRSVLPPAEEVEKMEENKEDEITEMKETTGGRGRRRRRIKSKLMKLMHRKPKASEKLRNSSEQEAIGERKGNEDLFISEEESALVLREVIFSGENDYSGCLIVISVVLAGLCFGHTPAMAITIVWFLTMKLWMYFISTCKTR